MRQCAEQQGLSVSTVVAVYDQLQAQGLVEARKNCGFFVRDLVSKMAFANASHAQVAAKTIANTPVDATVLIRGMFHPVSAQPQPGMGVFPPDWLETRFMPAAVRKVASSTVPRCLSASACSTTPPATASRPAARTRLCALDGLQRTLYVSGFSKILASGWRVGFLAAPPNLVERLLNTKLLATLTTPALFEKALAWCIDQARGRSVKLALAHGCTFAAEPAGLFGWVDTGVDTELLAQRLLDEGYLLAPGALFHAVRSPCTLMRINFATTQEAAFWAVFARLRHAVR